MALAKSTKGDYRKTLMFVKANEANIQTTPELVFICWSNNPRFSTIVDRNGKDLPCLLRTEGRCQNQRFKASFFSCPSSYFFSQTIFSLFACGRLKESPPLNVSRPQGGGRRTGKNFCRRRRRRRPGRSVEFSPFFPQEFPTFFLPF